jgi:hypothetical protein
MRRRVLFRHDVDSDVASISTILLVAIVVALMTVVGMFAYGIVDIPEDPPSVEVVYTDLNDRWSIHFSDVSTDIDFSDFRLLAHREDGNYVQYDADRDGAAEALLAIPLEDIVSGTGGAAQSTPIVFIDVDGDGAVSAGDILIVYSEFIPNNHLCLDATLGHQMVGGNPYGIPLDSDLTIVASSNTLAGSNIQPGDPVHLEILHGGTVEATREGFASASGTFITEVYMDPSWLPGNHKAEFIVRAGEDDVWIDPAVHLFKIDDQEPPLTEAELELYASLSHPLGTGDIISLVYEPTNTVILEFRL